MAERITLVDYQTISQSLNHIDPLGICCGNALLLTVHVEPLEGRKKTEVKRTCVVQCPDCEKLYVSNWD
jgi:hypothetical protein